MWDRKGFAASRSLAEAMYSDKSTTSKLMGVLPYL